jgi:hypothetical protein
MVLEATGLLEREYVSSLPPLPGGRGQEEEKRETSERFGDLEEVN